MTENKTAKETLVKDEEVNIVLDRGRIRQEEDKKDNWRDKKGKPWR